MGILEASSLEVSHWEQPTLKEKGIKLKGGIWKCLWEEFLNHHT